MSYLENQDTAPLLSEYEIQKTANSIVSMQTKEGAIAKTLHGSIDVWNHLEAAMALTVAGYTNESEKALLWVRSAQNADGWWYCAYDSDGVASDKSADTNQCSYVASAVLHNFMLTKNQNLLFLMWPVVVKALNFVTGLQDTGGCIPWTLEFGASTPPASSPKSLFAASCSVYHSLKSAIRIADVLLAMPDNIPVPVLSVTGKYYDRLYISKQKLTYVISATALRESLIGYMVSARHSACYIDKNLYAMDHYYSILASIITEESLARLQSARSNFIADDWGVRCLSDKDWFTSAETAEWAIAEACLGNSRLANELFATTFRHRLHDGSYLTGDVFPGGNSFPPGETSSYSAAAVILANDVISGGMTRLLFSDYEGK